MRIAVCGAGSAGSYLSYLLGEHKVEVDLYDRRPLDELGYRCAWLVDQETLRELAPEEAEIQVYNRPDKMVIEIPGDGVEEFPVRGLTTFNKNRFLRSLIQLSEAEYHQKDVGRVDLSGYDLIVDASGTHRALLPKPEDEANWILPCYQRLVHDSPDFDPDTLYISPRGTGYLWCFPFGDTKFRVGCGSYEYNPKEEVDQFLARNQLRNQLDGPRVLSGSVRSFPPSRSWPMSSTWQGTPVIGVGEAIGAISPLTGEGIIPSMKSSKILCSHIRGCEQNPQELDAQRYSHVLQREFKVYEGEYKLLRALRDDSMMRSIYHGLSLSVPPVLGISKWKALKIIIEAMRNG